jgi:hypothetical protein
MKRAKIFLTALTVLTVAGGALAFKAHNAFSGNLKCGFAKNNCILNQYVTTTTTTGTDLYCTPTTHSGSSCAELYHVTFSL